MPDGRYLRKLVDGVSVVAASAEIDITNAGQLRAVLVEAIGTGHPVVVVDMTGTLFCDASGLHILIRAHKRAMSEGGELRVVVPADGAVSRVIHLTCLDHLIPCFSSLAGALARTRPAAPAQLGALADSHPSEQRAPGLEEVRLSPHAELQALSGNALLPGSGPASHGEIRQVKRLC